jgi:hypothetical protein
MCSRSGSYNPIHANPAPRRRTSSMASECDHLPGNRRPSTYTAQSTTYTETGTGMVTPEE